MSEFDQPCALCHAGKHDQCHSVSCGCIVDHPDDEDFMRGFKRIKRGLHPERESWTKGGWGNASIRVQATAGERKPDDHDHS